MRFAAIERAGGRIAYTTAGPEGAPAVLFLHGFACGRRMWVHQIRRFSRTHRVVAIDFRGHGASDAPADPDLYSETIFAEDACAVLDALGIGRAAVCGLSMGGGVALTLALTRPERVSALVVADTGSGSDDPARARRRGEAWIRILRERGVSGFADTMTASPLLIDYMRRGGRQSRHMRLLVEQNDATGLACCVERVQGRRPPVTERGVDQISAPTLVVVGERDEACLGPSRYLAGTIPGARLAVMPGCGHMTALEDAPAFDALLAGHLARVQ